MSQRALLLEAHHTTHIRDVTHPSSSPNALGGREGVGAKPDDARAAELPRGVQSGLRVPGAVSQYRGTGPQIHQRLVEGGGHGVRAYRTVQNYVVNGRTRRSSTRRRRPSRCRR